MPVWLTSRLSFPDPAYADENGIVAVGGDCSWQRLLMAYQKGIFPWPHHGLPLLWFCPDPRFVIEPHTIALSRSLKKLLKTTDLVIKADTNFLAVIKKCQAVHSSRKDGTWINDDMIEGYYALHQQGFAHSIEAYSQDQLVGGLYGVSVFSIFFGESMFFVQPNASKICFITLVAHLLDWQFSLIDCQAHTHHLLRFGAQPMSRNHFLSLLARQKNAPSKMGPWLLHMNPQQALTRLNHS